MAHWRSLLPEPDESDRIPLAVGIELRRREPYDPSRWDPRAVESVTPRTLARTRDGLQLAARPLVPGARGGWVKADVSWDTVRRMPERYAPAHAQWFAELYALAAVVSPTGPFAAVSEWLRLDTVRSAHVWRHFADADALGIPFVATHAQQTVRVARSADAAVEVSRAADGGLVLRARVRIDGEPVDPADVHAIGDSGVFAAVRDRDPLPLVLAPVALPEPLPALVGATHVRIPEAETEEFWSELYPALARRVRVEGAQGLALPALTRPTLRVAVAFRPEHVVAFALDWMYAGESPVPFDAAAAPGRDAAAEAGIAAAAETAWAAASTLPLQSRGTLRGTDAAEFSAHVLPALERVAHVRVEMTGERPAYRELGGDPAIRVTAVEGADPDWFDLGILVTIDGRTIPFGPLLTALVRGRRRMMLSDGAYFSLAHPALERLKDLLDEAQALAEWETGPRIHRTQIALWDDFEDLADEAEPARAWRELVAGLRDTAEIPRVATPRGVRAELREYQAAGLAWLAFLHEHGLGGILADDMGLGKTLQTLALVAHAREQGTSRPFLVVAPTSVLATWRDEAARFTPGLVVRTVAATSARAPTSLDALVRDADIVVTSYAVLRLDAPRFAAHEWAGVILDEAQFVKNPRTRVHAAVAALRTRMTLAITGTPLENSLTDVWALLALTAPGLFPSACRFREEYVRPIEQAPDAANTPIAIGAAARHREARLARLRRRIRPFVLRRTKELVATELPPVQEQDVHVELSPGHRALYDTVLQRERTKVLGLLDDLDRNRFTVFRSLTLLRMLSLAPALIDPHASAGSAKLDELRERVSEVAAEGHRALVFSQFTSFLDLVEQDLAAAGIPTVRLDGSTPRRDEVVARFRAGDAPVFLISLKAGGFGLTLTEADYVFLLDPWWNPASEAQAIDRTHRIGQERTVFVYRLLSAGTIEQKVAALQRRKAELFQAVLDDGNAFARALDADDIRALLAE